MLDYEPTAEEEIEILQVIKANWSEHGQASPDCIDDLKNWRIRQDLTQVVVEKLGKNMEAEIRYKAMLVLQKLKNGELKLEV